MKAQADPITLNQYKKELVDEHLPLPTRKKHKVWPNLAILIFKV